MMMVIIMIYYNKLWYLLIKNNMNKTNLCEKTKISSSTMAKISKNEMVELHVLYRICKVLKCDIGDIVSFYPEGEDVENEKN